MNFVLTLNRTGKRGDEELVVCVGGNIKMRERLDG